MQEQTSHSGIVYVYVACILQYLHDNTRRLILSCLWLPLHSMFIAVKLF